MGKHSNCNESIRVSLLMLIFVGFIAISFGYWMAGGFENHSINDSMMVGGQSVLDFVFPCYSMLAVLITEFYVLKWWAGIVEWDMTKKDGADFQMFGILMVAVGWFGLSVSIINVVFIIMGIIIWVYGWTTFNYCRICKVSNNSKELIHHKNKWYCQSCYDALKEDFSSLDEVGKA